MENMILITIKGKDGNNAVVYEGNSVISAMHSLAEKEKQRLLTKGLLDQNDCYFLIINPIDRKEWHTQTAWDVVCLLATNFPEPET